MEKKLIEQFIDDESGVFAISLVSNPAIEKDFIMLSETIKLSLNEEKRMVTGAILVPDLPILRLTQDNEPYHIFFSKETVEKVSQKYLTDHNQEQVTLEHQVDVPDVVLIESWIKTDEVHDKTIALGVDAPIGSWVGSFKVNNEEVWENIIKKGLVKGFSIEGLFKTSEVEQSKNQEMDKDNFLEKFKEFVLGKEEAETVTEVVEMATKESVTELCGKVDSLTEMLQKFMEAEKEVELNDAVRSGKNPQQGQVQPIPEKEEEKKEELSEVVEEVKETVEMIAHTDSTEELSKAQPKFDYNLTPSERIALSMKQ